MNVFKISTQFKRDLKRYKHRRNIIDKLEIVLNILREGKPVPENYRPHRLTGDYVGYMECHIESDTLLIWWDREAGVIKLVRFGSRSELF